MVPAGALLTPEMEATIGQAFAGVGDNADVRMAVALEYLDAFVEYVALLDNELGPLAGDSVAFVMEKYGAGVTDSDNSNIAAFVAAQLETVGQ